MQISGTFSQHNSLTPGSLLQIFLGIILFIHLFMAVLGLHCCVGFSLVAARRNYSLVSVSRLLTAVASLVVEHCFSTTRAAVPRLSLHSSCGTWAYLLCCSPPRGIFLGQGSNLCLLHWQVASYPLNHQGSPRSFSYFINFFAFKFWQQCFLFSPESSERSSFSFKSCKISSRMYRFSPL